MRTGITAALLALVAAPAARAQQIVGPVEVIATFNPALLETPEGVAIDSRDNRYVILNLTGEIRKIDPDGTQSTYSWLPMGAPPLTPCFGFVPITGPLAIDNQNNLYIGVNSCDLAARGVYKIDTSGVPHLLANLPGEALANGITLHEGTLYLADTARQVILRVPASGGEVDIWKDDPLLKKDPTAPAIFPGPNGIQFFDDEAYVSVSGGFRIVAIPVNADGSAGDVRVHAGGVGCDDFAFDVRGDLYCTTDPFETMVLVRPDGSPPQVLLGAADGLDGPTATVFGRRANGSHDLYITNGMFPFFDSTGHGPSLLRVTLDVPGIPR
jgi:sugar lactone lactonase YvrE